MRKSIVLAVVLLLPIVAFSQKDTELTKAWKNLSAVLFERSTAADNIGILALDAKSVKKADADSVRDYASILSTRLRNVLVSDSMSIRVVYKTYSNLDAHVKQLIQVLDADSSFSLLNSYNIFRRKYLDSDNKVRVAAYEFERLYRTDDNLKLYDMGKWNNIQHQQKAICDKLKIDGWYLWCDGEIPHEDINLNQWVGQ